MRIVLIIFNISLMLILGWVFLWPLLFDHSQFSRVLHVGALGTLVLFLIAIIGLVVIRQRNRQTET